MGCIMSNAVRIISSGTSYGDAADALRFLHRWKRIASDPTNAGVRPVRMLFGGDGTFSPAPTEETCYLWVRPHNEGTCHEQLAMTQNWIWPA